LLSCQYGQSQTGRQQQQAPGLLDRCPTQQQDRQEQQQWMQQQRQQQLAQAT
jgi:hypothetical protein